MGIILSLKFVLNVQLDIILQEEHLLANSVQHLLHKFRMMINQVVLIVPRVILLALI